MKQILILLALSISCVLQSANLFGRLNTSYGDGLYGLGITHSTSILNYGAEMCTGSRSYTQRSGRITNGDYSWDAYGLNGMLGVEILRNVNVGFTIGYFQESKKIVGQLNDFYPIIKFNYGSYIMYNGRFTFGLGYEVINGLNVKFGFKI